MILVRFYATPQKEFTKVIKQKKLQINLEFFTIILNQFHPINGSLRHIQ